MVPVLCFGQVKVEVSQKQTFTQSYNEALKANAASAQARAANAAAMSDAGLDITTPITTNLDIYTHIALVSVKYSGGSMKKSVYYDMENDLIDSPFIIINPFTYDKIKAKKDVRFLKTIKNPNWLYYYYERSTVGVDQIRRVVVRDENNKVIYNATGTNITASKIWEPLVFAEVKNKARNSTTDYIIEPKVKEEAEAKARAEYEAKLKEEAEAKAKAEYEAKLKEEAELDVTAETDVMANKEKDEEDLNFKKGVKLTINKDNMLPYKSTGILKKNNQLIYKKLGITYRAIVESSLNNGTEYTISKVQYYVPLTSLWVPEVRIKNYTIIKSKYIIGFK